jgi:glutamine amidotransferase
LIGIVDYGAGNLKSVQNALAFIGAEYFITSESTELAAAQKVILPGVGSFGDAMNSLRKDNLDTAILDFIATGKPFLGICLGLQVLFEESAESPGVPGLGVFAGKVSRFPAGTGLKVPHIGWNSLNIRKPNGILTDIPDQSYVYFVHSYYVCAADQSIVSATTDYGLEFHAAVASANVQATQFHPEKSGDIGIAMLRNFVEPRE